MKIRDGKDDAWYCICRVNAGKRRTPAYVVNIKRHGLKVSKRFAIVTASEEQAALEAARQWRDRVLSLLPPMTSKQLQTLVRRNNKSGISGVSRVVKPSGAYWTATCDAGGKKQQRHFSVDQHGEEAARQMAIEARQQMLQSVQGTVWLATSAARKLSEGLLHASTRQKKELELVWQPEIKTRLLNRLREEGLIGKPATKLVRRCQYKSQSGPVWEAVCVSAAGKRIVRRFSVRKYGEKEAERLAQQAYLILSKVYSTASSGQAGWVYERLAGQPHQLLDLVASILGLKTDAALAEALYVYASTISRIRQEKMPLGATLMLRVLEVTNLSIRQLEELLQLQIHADRNLDMPDKTSQTTLTHAQVSTRTRRATAAI